MLALALVSACAPKTVPSVVVQPPRFPDFVTPTIPPEYVNAGAGRHLDRGWRLLQAGDLKTAERELSEALRMVPGLVSAETSLAYLDLARQDPKAALARFDRAVERQRNYAPALAGRGQALLALDRSAEALAAFQAAVAANPSLTDVSRRIEVLKFRVQQQDLTAARQAAGAGRFDEAIRSYGSAIAASPDSSFLYRELADVERQKGDGDSALAHWRKAVSLDPSDARSLDQIGDLLQARGDVDGALRAFADALAIEPNRDIEAKAALVRGRAALARLPDQYRAINGAAAITRGDLAALVGVRLSHLLEGGGRGETTPMTDVRGHWASTWILAVARAGVMEPFANHTFQPRTIVRRVDFAPTASRLLARLAAGRPGAAKSWESARLKFADLAPGHLAYVAASETVAAGVIKVGPDNRFQPSKALSGAEAIEAIARLETLAASAAGGVPGGPGGQR